MPKQVLILESTNSAATAPNTFFEKLSFKFIKPQVQGVSLSTWGVYLMELRFQLTELIRAFQARRTKRRIENRTKLLKQIRRLQL